MGKAGTRLLAAALCGAVCACLWASPPSPDQGLAAAAFWGNPAAALAAAGQAVQAGPSTPGAGSGQAAPETAAESSPAASAGAVPQAASSGAGSDSSGAAAGDVDAGGMPDANSTGANSDSDTAAPTLAPLPNTGDPSALLPLPQEAVPAGMAPLTQRFYNQDAGGQTVAAGAGSIRNCTDLTNAQVAEETTGPLPFQVEMNSAQPQVLIVHTHATECYEDAERPWADPASSSRTTDTSRNMIAVGAAMAQVLNESGVNTLQDTTLHDYPSYTGSYAASNETVRAYLAEYPSIKVVVDVHRDAIGGADGSRTKPVFMFNGEKCAQVMLICGADNGGNLPNFRQNLRFAARWQDAMATLAPGLARPCLFDYRYYNQDLSPGSLLLEVGSHGNTLDEAIRGGQLAAKALAALLANG